MEKGKLLHNSILIEIKVFLTLSNVWFYHQITQCHAIQWKSTLHSVVTLESRIVNLCISQAGNLHRLRRCVPLKRWLTSTKLQSIVTQKMDPCTNTSDFSMRICNVRYPLHMYRCFKLTSCSKNLLFVLVKSPHLVVVSVEFLSCITSQWTAADFMVPSIPSFIFITLGGRMPPVLYKPLSDS